MKARQLMFIPLDELLSAADAHMLMAAHEDYALYGDEILYSVEGPAVFMTLGEWMTYVLDYIAATARNHPDSVDGDCEDARQMREERRRVYDACSKLWRECGATYATFFVRLND